MGLYRQAKEDLKTLQRAWYGRTRYKRRKNGIKRTR